jgi:hypothetical protein
MSLAWSSLNHAQPDPRAAEEYAERALSIVPYWHYVRDILLPQIRRARQSWLPRGFASQRQRMPYGSRRGSLRSGGSGI